MWWRSVAVAARALAAAGVLACASASHAQDWSVAPPPPPPPTSAAWFGWYHQLLEARLAACPRERSRTFHFAQSGSDAAGDGTAERPWRTLAKARQTLAQFPAGDVALLFRRGDVWRETVGLDAAAPAVTIADYGPQTLEKPLFTPFQPVADPSAWRPAAGLPGVWALTLATPHVSWFREADRLGEPYARMTSAAGVAGTPRSWWWDAGARVLYVRPREAPGAGAAPEPSDPRVDGRAYEWTGPAGSGVIVRGDRSRIENIRAHGWGMQPASPSQMHGIETRLYGDARAVVVGCESFYGSSHAMTQYAPAGRGGIATFVDCRAGWTSYNSVASETVFNTYAEQGGTQTIWHRCEATYGTLPSAEWGWQATRRAGSFYAHSLGAQTPMGLTIAFETRMPDNPGGASIASSFNDMPRGRFNLPFFTTLADIRGFAVGEVVEGGLGTSVQPAPAGMVRLNCRYLNLTPGPGMGLMSATAQHGWTINTTFELNLTGWTGPFGMLKTLPNFPHYARFWHSAVLVRQRAGVTFAFDFDFSPNQSGTADLRGSIVSKDGGGAAYANFGDDPLDAVANAYFGMIIDAGSPRAVPVDLLAPATDGPPACSAGMAWAAPPLPGGFVLEFDQRGRLGPRRTIGPIEGDPACGDANADGRADVEDLYRQSAAPADLTGDGAVDARDVALAQRRARHAEAAAMGRARP